MPRWTKLLIGLAASLLAGWIYHGPAGGGERFIDALEARARLRVSPEVTSLPGISVHMQRHPLARIAILSGEANDFQKEGLERPYFPGINDRIRTIPGIAGLRWEETDCCGERR